MPLFSLRPNVARSSVWPVGALLCAAGATAHAQNASPSTAPPVITDVRPSGGIAVPQKPTILPQSQVRSLPKTSPGDSRSSSSTALPTPRSSGVSSETTTPKAVFGDGRDATSSVIFSGNSAPQTLISPAKRIKIASKSHFAASRVSSKALISAPLGLSGPRTVSAAPIIAAPTLVPVVSVAPILSTSLRDRMARLPSRGGLFANRTPVDLRPIPPETGAISDSQRRLLAQLDADLGRAQRRLDRAETRLTEGQRQLGNFTGVLRSAMLDAGDDARGLHPFVRVAQRYMGTPYVWGGESARGFDCSGFIMRVMRDLGYSALPHSAAEQFRYGLPVAKSLLKPGDIVFFANTYKPGVSHVGIYLGRNRFIHAANSKVGTIVSGLNDPKWVEHYAGARRLLPVRS